MSEPVHTTETPATDNADTAGAAAQQTDWEAEAKKWEKRSKDNFAKLKDAEPKLAELDQLRQANQSESERQAAELTRWQTEAERWRTDAVGSRIQAAAAADFADPSDAVSALDPAKYLDAGGQIDDDAIRADLADVLERKPHWRRGDGTPPAPRVPAPNPHQGSGVNGRNAPDPAAEFASILQSQLNQRSG